MSCQVGGTELQESGTLTLGLGPNKRLKGKVISSVFALVEWLMWSGLTLAYIYYGVNPTDLSNAYEVSATLVNYGLSFFAGFIATALNHGSTKVVRFTMLMIFLFGGVALASSIGRGPDPGLTFLRGIATTALAISLGACSFLIADRKATAENRRLAHQLEHKETRRLMQWGLFDRAVEDDAVFDDGRLNLEARYECPNCHTWNTWRDVYSGVRGVEKALKPKSADWLVHCQNLTPYDRDGEPMDLGADPGRVEFYPSELQDLLDCSGSEAKRFIGAATKLGLVGQGDNGWPRCSECVNAKARTRLPMSPRLRRQVLMRDLFTCQSCGENKGDDPELILHVDHIIPVSAGGQDVMDNLQVLCMSCNLGKSDDEE
jgi:hypothetical protein